MRRLLPLLLLLPILGACAESEPASGGSEGSQRGTVTGTVLLGPTCPVETESSPCPDEPLSGMEVEAVSEQDTVVATTISDEQGAFTFDLAPGSYLLRAVLEDDPARSAKPVQVTVVAGQTVGVDVPVDSGIR